MVDETSVLMFSVLDLDFEPNQRITKIAEIVGVRGFGPTTLVYKKSERNRHPLVALISMFTISWRDYSRNGIRMNEMNPFWNIPIGINARFVTFLVEWFDFLGFLLSGIRAVSKRRRAFDICIVQGPMEALAGLVLKKLKAVRMLVYDDFDYIPGWYVRKFRSSLMKCAEYYTMKRADVVISSGSLLSMLRRIQVGKTIHHIPNGVDTRLFGDSPRRTSSPSTGFRLKLVYTGNISFRYSGLDLVYDALELFMEHKSGGISLTIAGHGDNEDVKLLERKVLHLKNRGIDINYLGAIPHEAIPEVLHGSDIGLALFPPNKLRMFAFPYKVIEYMAAGLMVLGTERTETARILKKHNAGIALEYDCTVLSDLLMQLLVQPGRIKAMQQSGAEGSTAYEWKNLLKDEHGIILEYWSEHRNNPGSG